MRILVAGCTGGTGRAVTMLGLAAGHQVTALARRPERIDYAHPRLRLVAGDVRDPLLVAGAVRGQDAVVSTLGIGLRRHPTNVYSLGTQNLVKAMRREQVDRLVVQSSTALGNRPGEGRVFRGAMAVLHRVLAAPYADMRVMETVVRSSGLDWTLVRAARLTSGPLTGTVRASVGGQLRAPWSLSRTDCAWWMLDHLTDLSTYRQPVDVAY